jgi:uncharacterized protein (DUF433 family)
MCASIHTTDKIHSERLWTLAQSGFLSKSDYRLYCICFSENCLRRFAGQLQTDPIPNSPGYFMCRLDVSRPTPHLIVLKSMQAMENPMDWSECTLVEVKPDVQHGRPVLRGTRMPADDIVENWEAGVDESAIAEDFRLPIEQVHAILAYASGHQSAPHPIR